MAGGFCERHGPFDPPHESCPYCAMENGVSGRPAGGPEDDDVPTNIGYSTGPDYVGPLGETALTQPNDWPDDELPTALQYGEQPAGYGGTPPDGPAGYGPRPPYGGPPGYGSPPHGVSADYGEQPYGETYEHLFGEPTPRFDDDLTQLDLPEEQPVVEPLAFLFIQQPVRHRGQVITVLPGNTIGRRNADIIIQDQKISRQHARINLEPPDEEGNRNFAIFDFGTANGTFVNGERILGRHVLEENDEIRLGGHTFVFKMLM